MPTEFIFVVGASRSGTTLIRLILNRSHRIVIFDENHFLGHLIPWEGARYKFRRLGDLSNDDNVRRLVDYIYNGEFAKSSRYRGVSSHWRSLIKWVDEEDFLHAVLDSDRSERALFTIMMRVLADQLGKPITGEKTPIHFRYVPTLMEWFPDGQGKVIHMLRDPRGVFISDLRRRKKFPTTFPFNQLKHFDFLFKLYVMLQTTAVWFESVLRATKYRQRYPNNYYVLRFEDLVSDPERHIRQVCDFLGVEFQAQMLDQEVFSQGFRSGKAGFDAQAATRWKKHIDPWINAWFSLCFRRNLKEFGYADSQGKAQ